MTERAVVVERTSTGFSAFSPDLPGVVATGETEAEVRERLEEAVRLHLAALEKRGRDAGA